MNKIKSNSILLHPAQSISHDHVIPALLLPILAVVRVLNSQPLHNEKPNSNE